jgi:hypothetical protein
VEIFAGGSGSKPGENLCFQAVAVVMSTPGLVRSSRSVFWRPRTTLDSHPSQQQRTVITTNIVRRLKRNQAAGGCFAVVFAGVFSLVAGLSVMGVF